MHAVRMTRFMPAALVPLAVLLSLTSSAAAAVTLPNGTTLKEVDFERHVMGLFGKMGCNSGSCHGSFQGKGGFRLSLFGFEPHKDYAAVTRDMSGRRINAAEPDQSLLLLKATGQIPHAGGTRFGRDSWQYKIFRDWIAADVPWSEGSGAVRQIRITPPEHAFKKKGETVSLKITAEFTDGSKSDITPFCDFRTNDDAVAEVSGLGEIKSLRPGSTAIIVSYRGHVLPVNVLVPVDVPAHFVYPRVPEKSYLDRLVFDRLKKLKMVPSELSSDTEFLRRVYIDTIGRLPEPAEIRAFLKDRRADKRARKIDELLEHPLHAALWATKFCDITGNDTLSLENPQQLKYKRSQMWHDWFRKRVQENMPYDEIVRGVLVATSRDGKSPEAWANEEYKLSAKALEGYDFDEYASRPSLDLYWRRQQRVPIEQWGERTAAAFMGIRLECAQCHKHPFDRWSQEEYRAYANIFTAVAYGVSPEAKKVVTDFNNKLKKGNKKNNRLIQLREVYLDARPSRGLTHPDTGKPLPPRALGGPEIEVQKGEDPREALFDWLHREDNPFFARSFVNRVWGHYLGVGIVDPVDDFSLANPPSNARLLDALARDFIDHKFDIRHIERQILNSRVYQLSAQTNATNELDRNNYAHAYVRPMMAEVVVDVINSALGVQESFGKTIRPGTAAVEIGPSVTQSQQVDYAFRVFGRPPRTSACDCERAMDPALPQKLFLMTDGAMLRKLQQSDNRLNKLLKTKMSDEQIFDELFLAALSRFPTDQEKQRFAEYRQAMTDRRAAFTDTLWALLNTREFILNH